MFQPYRKRLCKIVVDDTVLAFRFVFLFLCPVRVVVVLVVGGKNPTKKRAAKKMSNVTF